MCLQSPTRSLSPSSVAFSTSLPTNASWFSTLAMSLLTRSSSPRASSGRYPAMAGCGSMSPGYGWAQNNRRNQAAATLNVATQRSKKATQSPVTAERAIATAGSNPTENRQTRAAATLSDGDLRHNRSPEAVAQTHSRSSCCHKRPQPSPAATLGGIAGAVTRTVQGARSGRSRWETLSRTWATGLPRRRWESLVQSQEDASARQQVRVTRGFAGDRDAG